MRDESWTWYIGSPDAKGDAIKLGRSVNADLCGFGRGLVLLTPNFQRELEAYLPGWLLLTDDKGDRLCNETLSSGVLQRIVENCGGRVFAIFDETARLDAVPEGQGEYRGRLPGGAPWPQSPNFNSVTIAEQVGRGLVASETSVAGLAEVLSLPPARLEATVDRYMAAVCAGVDDDFGKESRFLRPIEKPPFYGVPLQLASVALTGTGLRIDARANVLNQNGRPIPNVYAAGECAGGVIGPRYMGNGNSWASCLTFGRIAGRNAGLRMAAKNVG
jgi:fumarate reductase flavoprotein subunit